MLAAVLTGLFLIAQPPVAEAPPPRLKGSVSITFVGDATFVVPNDRNPVIRWTTVKTANGPRIRIEVNGIAFDVTRVRFDGLDKEVYRMGTFEMSLDKEGRIVDK